MMSERRLGIDIMGSDTAPQHLWEGVVAARSLLPPSLKLVVLATEEVTVQLASRASQENIDLIATATAVTMEEDPLYAVRVKQNSSLVQGVKLLAEKDLDALVSCGNTSALLAASILSLPLLEGLKRPPLLAEVPTSRGKVALLDAGATLQCSPLSLLQFAYLGAAYFQRMYASPLPRVALLNVGSEPSKGGFVLREAFSQLLALEGEAPFSFIGNLEARDLFHADVDVIICDGFAGNVLLKTAEGLSLWLIEQMREAIASEPCSQSSALEKISRKFDYLEYPGAFFCGFKETLVKCHGSASPQAIRHSIAFAAHLLQSSTAEALQSVKLPLKLSYL